MTISIADTLSSRVAVIALATIVTAQVAVAIAIFSMVGGVFAGFGPAFPQQSAAIVRAVEMATPSERPAVFRALNAETLTVMPITRLPAVYPASRWPFDARYRAALGDRTFALEASKEAGIWVPESLSVRLRDGTAIRIARKPGRGPLKVLIAGGSLLGATVAAILLASMIIAIRNTTRPVARLAEATERFSGEPSSPDLPEDGPREITALARALNGMRRRVRAVMDERARVIAAIAHDMRTYITRLRLRAEFIADDELRSKAIADLSEMSAMLDDTILYAKGAERRPSREDAYSLRDFVLALVDPNQRDVQLGNLDESYVTADPVAVRRILENLTQNAIRYGQHATVSLHDHGTEVEMRVNDSGAGIPEDLIHYVLQPYARLESSRGRETGGTGLGLTIVQALVGSERGRLALANDAAGGLRASVFFPQSAEPA